MSIVTYKWEAPKNQPKYENMNYSVTQIFIPEVWYFILSFWNMIYGLLVNATSSTQTIQQILNIIKT